jgi:hypothetical protein
VSDVEEPPVPGKSPDMSEEQSTTETKDDSHDKAQEAEERHERAKAKMEEIEKDPPEKLEDWPDDEAKYETFGGSESGESTYDEHHEEALGAHSVRHHEDGSVEVKGEKVDDPDEFKGEPIPGGPTDPDAPAVSGEDKDAEDESGSSDSKKDSDED